MAIESSDGTGETVPLISNYKQACELFSEYASLEFKTVPDDNAADFPVDEAQQRELVTLIYEAIIDMSDILERKSPITLKKANTSGTKHDTTKSSGTTCQAETTGESGPQQLPEKLLFLNTLPPPPPPTTPVKENISVSKVKGLSRIEVWLLSWMILFSTHDIHRGRLPFLPWSKTDWGWDHSFTTFRQRLDEVINTLRRSKAAVCSLLESDYKSRLEAHPNREYRRKENNRAQNSERNAQVFVGRHTISKGNVQRNADGSLSDAQGNIVAPGDANHRVLIDQTVALSMMGSRGQKTKQTNGGHSGTRKLAAGVQKRSQKNKAEVSKINRAITEAAIEAKAANGRPKAIVPKQSLLADGNVALQPAPNNTSDFPTTSGLETPAGSVSAFDNVAPAPFVECNYNPDIKSGEEADMVAQLMTPPAELRRLTELPPQKVYTPSSTDTSEYISSVQPDGKYEPVPTLMSEPVSVTQDNVGFDSYGDINYAPTGYLDPANSICFAGNQWESLAAQSCSSYDMNSVPQVADMQTMDGLGSFSLQTPASSFQFGSYAATLSQADEAMMINPFMATDNILQTRFSMAGIDNDLFMNMAPSVDSNWNLSAEMGKLPMLGVDGDEAKNWDGGA